MDLQEDRYFFLGGLISVGFFTLLLFIVGYSVFVSPKLEQFAMTQSQYVSISIDVGPPKSSSKPVIEEEQHIQDKPKPVEEEKPQSEPAHQSVPEISDLFSKVKPEKTAKKTDDSAQKIEALSALERQMAVRTQSTPQLAEKVKNTALAKPSVKIVSNSGSTGPLVNEYHAKIQALIYANYYPPSGSQGQSARVRISLDSSGKLLGYRVMAYSGNEPFNNEVDWLKERLRSVTFPPHPDGKETVFEIILTAKE